jgi:hypothetical protein
MVSYFFGPKFASMAHTSQEIYAPLEQPLLPMKLQKSKLRGNRSIRVRGNHDLLLHECPLATASCGSLCHG